MPHNHMLVPGLSGYVPVGIYCSCRSAALEGMSVDALVAELKASLEWGEGVLAVVKHVWKEEGPALCSLPKEALSVGQVGGSSLSAIVDF